MAKHKWLKLTGLVLASHLILSNCQNKQETQTTPTTQTAQTTTSSSKQETTPDKDKDKNKDTTTTTTTPESTEKAIPGVTVPTSDGFILTENSVILSRTKDGIVVDHNGHSHFIFYSDLLGTKFAYLIPAGVTVTTTQTVSEQSPAQPASSGDHHYVFDPADIVAEDANGYTVRHGDHYHYILKSSLTGPYNQTSSSGTGGVISPVQPSQTNHQLPSAPSAGLAGIDYPTSDGFLFDGTGMSGWTDLGLLVNHNGHLHLLLTGDLTRSKWAYLLASRPGQPPAPTVSNPTPSAPDKPSQPAQPVVPVKDEVAEKRAYLARETGNAEDKILLIETANGQAFMYPHGDHHHVVLLSQIDVTKPFDYGHGDEHHDNHDHDYGSDQADTTGEGHEPTAPAQDSGNQAGDDTTSQTEPEQPTAPTQPVQDEVAVKRAYLAAATGLDEASIQLLDTPNGPAFMYPHGDHHHVVLLSQLDVTKPFDDGHGGHGQTDTPHDDHVQQGDDHSQDDQGDSGDGHSGDQDGNQDTQTDEAGHDHGSDQTGTTGEGHDHTDPDQDSGNQAGDDTTSQTEPEQPTAPTQPVQDEVAVKRAYLATATGLDEASIQLIDTPNGPAFMYPHGDHHHVVLLSQLDVTKPFDDGHGDHGQTDTPHDVHGQQGDDHNHDDQDHSDDAQSGDQEAGHEPGSDQADTTGDGRNHTDPAQDAGNQAGDDTTSPTEPGQSTPPGQPLEPTTPAKPGVAGIDYPTSDGFLFDGTGMAGWTSAGLLVNHNGHTHILPTEAIANSKWAHLLPKTDEVKPTTSIELSEKLAKQRDDLAKQLGLAPEDIRVVTADGKVVGFEYPHEDHYDFVPANTGDGVSSGLTEQDKRDLTAYIRKTYGLLLGTPVTFHDDFVVFAIPHPHQDYDVNRDYYSDVLDPAYDPGHVHPYAVPLSTLSIPVLTGIPELDFENELLLAAKRIGVAPSDVQIKNKKYFVLPGKDHDHYLNILTPVAGLDAYMANKLPDIKAHFALGDYSKEAVVAEVDRILAAAKDKFGAGTVEFRRVARALEAFKAHLTVPTTSTDGYVKALQSFENKYLKGLTEVVEEPAAVDEVVATYLRLTEKLQGYDERTLKNFGLNAGQKVAELKRLVAAKDEAGLARVATHFAAIDRVKAAANDLGPRLAYMDFFLRHVDSDKLPASLRQEVLDKLSELQKISGLYRNPQKFREGLESTALLKEKVKQALAADGPAPDHANWTPYPMGFDRREIVREVNSMRDFVIKHKEVTAEELAEGFNKSLELFKPHPKKPAQPVTPPVQPKPAEEGNQPVQPTDPETPPTGDPQPGTETNQPQPDQEGTVPGQGEETPDSPEKPAESTPVALDVQHEAIKTWLTSLTAANLRHYSIDRESWNSELDTALTNQDQVVMAKFQAYKSAIERVEKDKNINATRTTLVDYFLRQIDQPYLDETLRERVAQQLVAIYAANTYNFKKALVETVTLKVAIKSAQEGNQNHPMATGPSYQAYLEQKDAIVASVEQRKEWLISQNLITAEEIAEGFGQPYPPAP